MKDVVVGSLLGIAVVCAWLCAAGFARLLSALASTSALLTREPRYRALAMIES